MSYHADKIADHLFQGGRPPTGDSLMKSGIDVLVLCASEWQKDSVYPGVTVIKAPGDDDPRLSRMMQFIPTWRDAAKQVVDHVRAGRSVLVTCMAGQNRSGIVTAMALCELTGKSGKECVGHVARCRPFALNNETFARYVIEMFPGTNEDDQ